MFAALFHTHSRIFIFICLCIITNVEGRQEASSNTAPSLKYFFVFGDKFSGVAYTTDVLNNFTIKVTSPPYLQECRSNHEKYAQNGSVNYTPDTSWKHGHFSIKTLSSKLDCKMDETLFILVVKNPYAWLTSVARRKFNTAELRRLHLSSIVHHRWEDVVDLNDSSNHRSKTYRNFMLQRTQKLKTHSSIISKMQHPAVIKYEDLLKDQSQTIRNIFRGRGLHFKKDSNITNIASKSTDRTFQRKQTYYLDQTYLEHFTSEDILYTTNKLSKKLETGVYGYEIPPNGDWPWVEEEIARQSGLMGNIWNFAMNVLWWVVVPTTGLLISSTPLLVWKRCKLDERILQERKQMKNR